MPDTSIIILFAKIPVKGRVKTRLARDLDARASGIAYSGNHLVDVDAYASFVPLPFVRIQGGYRYIDLKIDEDGTLASFKLKGPYLGAQLSF